MDPPRGYIAAASQWADGVRAPVAAITGEWLESAGPVGGYEPIDLELAAAETMFLGLRLLDGLDLVEASSRLGIDLSARYGPQIEELLALGLLERQDQVIRLHESAYLIANQVFTRFLE